MELLVNRPKVLWLPRALCLFHYRSPDFENSTIIPDYEFEGVMETFGFDDDELAALNGWVAGRKEGESAQEFVRGLSALGVSALHDKRVVA